MTRGRVHVSWLRIAAPLLLVFVVIASLRAFVEAARQPAADAPRLEFTVDGLDCPVWCAVRLSDGIDGLDGAEVEQIDQKNGKVVVRFDPARQNEADLTAQFAQRGFPVRAVEPASASRQH